MMKKRKLGIIGGSGLYKMEGFEKTKWKKVITPWGKPSDEILIAKLDKEEIYFIPRHSRGHKINPTNINFRANIDSMKQLGVTDIISVSAVGSLKEDLNPGTFVIVDQFVDRTFSRVKTFFDDEIVAHVSMAKPTSPCLSECCETALKKLDINYQMNGTYIVMEGPQFSTLAESNLYRSWNADVIGMTNMPEAKLAKEAEIRYCSISMVTDYDCWHPDHENVDINILLKTLSNNVEKSKLFINEFCKYYYQGIDFSKDDTSNILNSSIVTNKSNWTKESEIKLSNILKRYNAS